MTTTLTRATRPRYARLALTLILTCQLMLILDATVVTVALPQIRTGLRFSPTGLAWVMDAYTLAFGGLLLLGGRAGDLLGRRRLLLAGIALFTAASLVGGFAGSAGMLIAARTAQGVGAAMAAPSALALVVTTFDGPARVRAIALYSAISGAGSSVGLIVGGMLTAWVSWRWVLFVNVPIGIALVLLAPLALAETPRATGRPDVAGALTATGAVGAGAYGFLHAAAAGWRAPGTVAAFAVAVPLLVAFLLVESRVRQPLLPLRLFADRNRVGAYLSMLLLPAAMFGAFFFVSQYLAGALRYDALRTGAAFLPLTGLSFVVARYAPRLIARFGAKPTMLAGALFLAAGTAWLSRLDAADDYLTGVLGPMALLGVGVGASFVPASATILGTVAPADTGAASGTLQTLQQIGGALGLAVLTTVYGAAARGPHAAADGTAAAFGLACALVLAAGVGTALLIRRR
ncbi:MFS transporter [Actinocatenispora rupis]|uniref:MFS transporter n=1 Tax=Actinocatenispora rupis TaxID=519421 RepID=A0A8J3JBE6_9ACTN|nr:MFS transporter [Actinocatenispora rupis]GID13452.1 MFS transporter [Actinocatenispora rupis]